MKLILKRLTYDFDGIFGILLDEAGKQLSVTLEHAFDAHLDAGGYAPKVKAGEYVCQRHAPNRLPYETWALQNVPPFQGKPVNGILIHVGNYNENSDGCILVGRNVLPRLNKPAENMVTSSHNTFNKIMDLTKGLSNFTLVVEDK